MNRAVAILLPSLLGTSVGLSGCGGTSGEPLGGGAAGAPGDTGPARPTDCSAGEEYEFLMVDDFELGAATGAFTNNEVCARCQEIDEADQQELFACQDSCRESQDPTDFDKPLPAELIPEGRCGSRYALHIKSQSFHEWGGIVGFPFAPAIDVREYEGVSFWGRVAWGTRSTVRASVLDPETDATYVDPETGGALCAGESDLDEFEEACDAFGNYAVMTGDWRLYRIPFSEMRQRGYGHLSHVLDLGAILQVSIEYGMGAWDFWIDDISFYRQKEEE